ncbi:MAG: ECF-type sigma factor [Marinicellaceae bacterium]
MSNPINKDITLLLESDDYSQKQNIDTLFDLLYSEIRKIASSQLHKLNPDRSISPTILVNECYLKLNVAKHLNLKNRKHFYCIAAKSMRFYLMDLLKSHNSQKREGINTVLSLTKLTGEDSMEIELVSLDEAINELEQIDENLARIVELRFYWGFSLEEIATIFESSKNKIYQQWLMAKSLLLNLIQEQ